MSVVYQDNMSLKNGSLRFTVVFLCSIFLFLLLMQYSFASFEHSITFCSQPGTPISTLDNTGFLDGGAFGHHEHLNQGNVDIVISNSEIKTIHEEFIDDEINNEPRWISNHNDVNSMHEEGQIIQYYRGVNVPQNASITQAKVTIAADDYVSMYVNNNAVNLPTHNLPVLSRSFPSGITYPLSLQHDPVFLPGQITTTFVAGYFGKEQGIQYSISPQKFRTGANFFRFITKNEVEIGQTPSGLIYCVTIDYTLGRTVEVAINEPGMGRVISSDETFNCEDTCETELEFGSQITLIAQPFEDHSFVSWGGACQEESSQTCTLTLDDHKQVTATFVSDEALILERGVQICEVPYLCGVPDGVCPEDFVGPNGERVDCEGVDPDCAVMPFDETTLLVSSTQLVGEVINDFTNDIQTVEYESESSHIVQVTLNSFYSTQLSQTTISMNGFSQPPQQVLFDGREISLCPQKSQIFFYDILDGPCYTTQTNPQVEVIVYHPLSKHEIFLVFEEESTDTLFYIILFILSIAVVALGVARHIHTVKK